MDREPEQRRDLAPAQPAPNPLGGERFTVTSRHWVTGYQGRHVEVKQVLEHQAIGRQSS